MVSHSDGGTYRHGPKEVAFGPAVTNARVAAEIEMRNTERWHHVRQLHYPLARNTATRGSNALNLARQRAHLEDTSEPRIPDQVVADGDD